MNKDMDHDDGFCRSLAENVGKCDSLLLTDSDPEEIY